MEILAGLDLQTLGFVALATFGAVSATNMVKKKKTGTNFDPSTNFLLSVGFAFLFGFVPADLGSVIANRAKEAISIAVMLNGAYQFLSGLAVKASGNRS